ncbi:hypothetical protein M5K25_001328 [Dendrobium thyrsiflorum]|uniref:Uncharacterized protein n=1 Tax=Dendrobium thyrsiflorum TaxID=117978 RepID=A0ABD0VQ65_DENTH
MIIDACQKILTCFLPYLHRALNHRFSSTVKFPCTISSCGTNPMIFLYERMDSTSPFIRTEPLTSKPVVLPARALRNVVFPAPDGPITAARRPGINFPVTLFRSCFLLPFKVRVRSLKAISITGLVLLSISVAIEITPEKVKLLKELPEPEAGSTPSYSQKKKRTDEEAPDDAHGTDKEANLTGRKLAYGRSSRKRVLLQKPCRQGKRRSNRTKLRRRQRRRSNRTEPPDGTRKEEGEAPLEPVPVRKKNGAPYLEAEDPSRSLKTRLNPYRSDLGQSGPACANAWISVPVEIYDALLHASLVLEELDSVKMVVINASSGKRVANILRDNSSPPPIRDGTMAFSSSIKTTAGATLLAESKMLNSTPSGFGRLTKMSSKGLMEAPTFPFASSSLSQEPPNATSLAFSRDPCTAPTMALMTPPAQLSFLLSSPSRPCRYSTPTYSLIPFLLNSGSRIGKKDIQVFLRVHLMAKRRGVWELIKVNCSLKSCDSPKLGFAKDSSSTVAVKAVLASGNTMRAEEALTTRKTVLGSRRHVISICKLDLLVFSSTTRPSRLTSRNPSANESSRLKLGSLASSRVKRIDP